MYCYYAVFKMQKDLTPNDEVNWQIWWKAIEDQ